jgi:hypothetical protein
VAEGQRFEPLNVAKVSPFIVEKHELAGFLLIRLIPSGLVVSEDFEHKLYMDPAFGATTACHAMNHNAGLRVYIRPLNGQPMCPGLDEIRARAPHEHNGLVRADNLSRV